MKRAGSPLSTMNSWPLRAAGACSVPGPGAQPNVYLGRGGKTIGCRLWAEVGEAQNSQQEGQRTRTCCAAETAFARARGRDRRPGRKHIIYVPSWFSTVSTLRPTPIPCLQAFLSPWELSVGRLSPQGDSHWHNARMKVLLVSVLPDPKQPPHISVQGVPRGILAVFSHLASARLNTNMSSQVPQAQ